MFVHACTCLYTYVCTCKYTYVHTCKYTYVHTCMYIMYEHACTCMYMHTHMNTYVHVRMYMCSCDSILLHKHQPGGTLESMFLLTLKMKDTFCQHNSMQPPASSSHPSTSECYWTQPPQLLHFPEDGTRISASRYYVSLASQCKRRWPRRTLHGDQPIKQWHKPLAWHSFQALWATGYRIFFLTLDTSHHWFQVSWRG